MHSSSDNIELYDYPVSVIGANFRTLPLSERERLVGLFGEPKSAASEIVKRFGVKEAALLSTCNRFELVTVSNNLDCTDKILHFVAEHGFARSSFYAHQNRDAVRHLFRVTSSLDSMVVGEAQITGQVKDCYEKSVALGCAGKYLHQIFQFSLQVAKRVRNRTGVSARGVSFSYVAVKLAEQVFGELAGKQVLLIGSGRMAELALLHLKSYGCSKITIANRTVERAAELAGKLNAISVAVASLAEIPLLLKEVDVVIGSISCSEPIISAETMRKIKAKNSLLLIDLGLPRNFSADLAELDGVFLYNLDDLGRVVDENRALREQAGKEAEIIIDYSLQQFEKWLLKVAAQGEIINFRQSIFSTCKQEVANYLSGRLSGAERAGLTEKLSYSISNKISHEFTTRLAASGGKLSLASMLPLVIDELLDQEDILNEK